MRIKTFFLSCLLIASFLSNIFAMEKISQNEKGIHGIILKAELPDGRTLHFVPSHHSTLLSSFTQNFQKEVLKHSALILESVTPPSSQPQSSLDILKKYANRDFIESLNGFVKNAQDEWSLDFDSRLKYNLESTFARIADLEPTLGHFRDIYCMKPAVVFALGVKIQESMSHLVDPELIAQIKQSSPWITESELRGVTSVIKGMDIDIADEFRSKNKPVSGVETQLDVINSLNFSKKLDDIMDDLTNFDSASYDNSLNELHFSFVKTMKEKRLADEASLTIRNQSWMAQYPILLNKNPVSQVAVHGQGHFPGENGIIRLGLSQGWRWFVFQEDGTYRRFSYSLQRSTPFVLL